MRLSTGRQVAVYVTHKNPPPQTRSRISTVNRAVPQTEEWRGTVATVAVPGEEYKGRASVAPGDNFCKHTGVTIALKRALAQTDLSKAERGEVYDAVFSGKYATTGGRK